MKQYHTIVKKKNMLIILVLIFTISLVVISFADSQNVKVSIFAKPKIDIALAKSMTKTDVTNFKEDLYEQLKAQNIDTNDVEIFTVQAEQVDLTKNFMWQKDISSSIGSISITDNGQSVVMRGNYSLPGKNAIWIIPDKKNEDQCFTFDYNIDFGDSFNAAGMLLKVKQENNILTGYMLSFNNSDWNSTSGGYNGAIWEFSYKIGDNSNNMTKKLKKGLSINRSGTLTVNTTDTEITVEGGGLSSKQTYELEKEFGNGYGFFSDHYSHGCDSYGSFTLRNIQLEATYTKSFEEILRQPEWRDGSYRFLVDVTDKENPGLSESSKFGELVTRLINDNIYFIGVGKDKNENQLRSLLKENDNKGIFINNTDFNQSLIQIAKYIKSLLDEIKESNYLIVGEPVRLEVDPEDVRTNTADEKWPSGKWKENHDYEYYENDLGQSEDSGKYVPDIIKSFDKTGKFNLTYQDKAIDPENIYVHRKPVASFNMALDNGKVDLVSNSYDLDEFSNNNGISEEEWKWKTYGQTEWTNGKLTTYDEDKIYLIQLRVKDFQNTWSDKTTKFINIKDAPLPVAMFNLKENIITKYESLRVEDQSYDPTGKTISYNWEIYKDSTLVYSGNEVEKDFTNYELGDYTIRLVVTNSANVSSEQYVKKFTIVNDTIPPEVVADPVESDWTTSVTVNLMFSDRGGSQFKSYKYAITDSQDTPNSWSNDIYEANSSVIIKEESNKYLHIIAKDNEGNVSEDRVLGTYKIDRTAPILNIKADLETITTSAVDLVVNAEDAGSGLKYVTINGTKYVNGSIYKITTNGTYTIEAMDNLENRITKSINVTNINKVCDKGLGHIDYSSSLDECPICKTIKNVKILNDSFVYNGQKQGVSYKNPDKAEIVSYYNGKTDMPKNVGTYGYELRVLYNGVEYKTAFNGQMKITQKGININNIKATNRQYNGTTKVQLTGGELQGIEQVDNGKVKFIMPVMGTIDSKNVGKYNVAIGEIILTGETGEESGNYKLIQPQKTDVQVEITQKEINITNIKATNRQYNGTNNVQLEGGELQGIEQVDNGKVGFTMPKLGTIDSKNIGNYNVAIEEITLTGEESRNYKLIQPQKTDVQVEIIPKEINIINIKAIDKKYDENDKIKIVGGELVGVVDGDDVTFILNDEGIAESYHIGQWNVKIDEIKLEGKEKDNYSLIQPKIGDIKVNILDPDKPVIYSETTVDSLNEIKLQNEPNTKVRVKENDVIKLKINIKNKGLGDGYAKEISVKLPENIEFIENNEENKLYNWEESDDGTIKTDILKFENGNKNRVISSIEQSENEKEVKVEICLKVNKMSKEYQDLVIKTNIIQTDINNTIIENLGDNEEEDLVLRSNYSSFNAEEKIDSVNDEKIKISKNEQVKVENNDIVVFTLKVYNKGEIDTYVSKIIDYPEDGLEFIPDNEINKEYKWASMYKEETPVYISNYLEDKLIKASTENKENAEEIKIAFKVKGTNEKGKTLKNSFKIEETKDIYNSVVENINNDTSDEKDIYIKYFDLSLKMKTTSIKVYENDKVVKENIQGENKDMIAKIELERKRAKSLNVKVFYNIYITNEGEIAGYAKEIKDYLPIQMKFVESENENWTQFDGGTLICNALENEEIKPGETKAVTLCLNWINDSSNFGAIKNEAEISKDDNKSQTKDIDSTPNNRNDKEDDIDKETMLISISTGAEKTVGVVFYCIIISLCIYVYMKKR